MSPDSGIPFAAYIHPSNPPSGPYSGLSFVIFPVVGESCLIGMVVGTQGLAPDEAVLGRPGHARKMQAICEWMNREYGAGSQVAWAKQDPTRVDLNIPKEVRQKWPEFQSVFERYGPVLYAFFRPTANRTATEKALKAFLDVMFAERGHVPLTNFKSESEAIQSAWFEHLMPTVERSEVASLLERRRYVIIQGPPGTGKTRMAGEILAADYAGMGQSIQFHPNTTYENFIGGLNPVETRGELGFRFAPKPGFLMEAAAKALAHPDRNFLLHIDEINRADLGKILGEAIYLLEVESESKRQIELPYDFGEPFRRTLFLPKNLHILGTMNSADRSIAIVDVAVRRRFAFVSLWPSMKVVEHHGCNTTQNAFRELLSIFVEHASDDAFPLVPGHSYFLESDETRAAERLRVSLAPLLDEYLAQGYVSGFAESIRSYLQWLRAL
jgi:5-methylcytosine-specific restriction protein B